MKTILLKTLFPILLLMVMIQDALSEEELLFAKLLFAELLSAEGVSGTVVDARSKKPIPYAVVSVAWVLQPGKDVPPAGQRTRLGVLQQYADNDGKFVLEGWTKMRADVMRGWEIVPGKDPMVRIYAQGYQRLDIANLKDNRSKRPFNPAGATVLKWVGQGKPQIMAPLATGDKALASELRQWRKDLDEEIQAVSVGRDKAKAMNSQQKLLALFNDQCKTLSDEMRQNICYAPDSDAGQYIKEDADIRSKNLVYDRPDGNRQVIPIQPYPRSSTGAASAFGSVSLPPQKVVSPPTPDAEPPVTSLPETQPSK